MKQIQPGNHIDQLIRQTRVHHVQLSMMADTKTSMLLTISSIVLTLAFSKLTEPQYRIAAAILVLSSVITVVICCLTVMPSLKKKFAGQKMKNLLFFNDFSEMNYDDYQNEMHSLLSDPTLVYEAQVKEIYQVGKYLYHRKYPLLRAAYIVFFMGFIFASVQLLCSLF
jgi:hypothetical protein